MILETMYYIDNELCNRKLFVHSYQPEKFSDTAIVFLSSIFDEKKRSQNFEVEMARHLCEKSLTVVRFDYYGNGDSYGSTFEFDLDNSLKDINHLIRHIHTHYSIRTVKLLGIRIGADLSLAIGNQNAHIREIILIEPIGKGKRYLAEKRLRRSAFFKFNHITTQVHFNILGKSYEDFQGYPLSERVVNFVDHLEIGSPSINGKNVTIIKLNNHFSKATVANLAEKLSLENSVTLKNVNCHDFWESKEAVDTSAVTEMVVSILAHDVRSL
ncbi:MAG: hypothetical protein EOO46_17270 [Flavobacterium sp.]|nr:MAG: hypothetical protein EOO46_17270 [Flavobacterium sp.]